MPSDKKIEKEDLESTLKDSSQDAHMFGGMAILGGYLTVYVGTLAYVTNNIPLGILAAVSAIIPATTAFIAKDSISEYLSDYSRYEKERNHKSGIQKS